uniref:IQ calmodulin-binding motif-containing protein 1 n=1 Tax=Magallana gigas TaxID=29159 RepID=K1QXP7_MAGGI
MYWRKMVLGENWSHAGSDTRKGKIETKDRGVPALLLNLREILASAPKGTKDGIRVRNECWEFNILQVLVLVLKQDFSIVDGDWQTAAALAAILSVGVSMVATVTDIRRPQYGIRNNGTSPQNPSMQQDIDKKLKFSIMDELIYKLSVNTDATIASAATKCVLKICDIHKPMIDVVCSRYKSRFARAATVIQTIWRGFIARKKLQKANKAFSKFQNTYRRKQRIMEKRKEEAKVAMELERRLKLNRQKIMREFKEKQLHTIEILPAAHVEKYMQNEQIQAAVKIQRIWRGHNCRQSIDQRKVLIQRYKAAIILQRGVRKWLEKVRKKRERFQFTIKPPGLTENRRVELQQKITQYREENPPQYSKREDLEKVHKKAAEMLQRHYVTLKSTREKHAHREALLARLDTDSELLSLAPPLKDAREKDIEMYSSNLLPIATKARTDHIETLRLLRQPWWKKLRDDLQDQEYEEEDYILF